MSTSDVLSRFLKKLLETGIVIDDGKEKIVISALEAHARPVSPHKGTGRKQLKAAVAAPSRPRRKSRRRAGRARTITPQRLMTILEFHKEGIAKASLSKILKVSRQKLAGLMLPLREKGRTTEDSLRYFPVMTSDTEEAQATRRRRKTCIVPKCARPHYAKGFCNNHYNITRREAARVESPAASRRVRPIVHRSADHKQKILDALRDRTQQYSLYELASLLDKKWQTLRKDIQELITENKVVKAGKKYVIAESL